MDNEELDKYIEKFSIEQDITLSTIDHIRIFNFMKELRMYRSAGLIREVLDLKSEYKKIKFAHDLQADIIDRLEKSNGEIADRLVKSEGLISENTVKENDFTDDEFRGMLGYILGYTSEDVTDEYKDLRDALVEEVKLTTGKDLRKCWLWM